MGRRIDKCVECNRLIEIHGKGLCNTCYCRKQYYVGNWNQEKFKARQKRNDDRPERREYHKFLSYSQFRYDNKGKCSNCGRIGMNHRHHINRDVKDYSENNIKLLCQTCHAYEHQKVV